MVDTRQETSQSYLFAVVVPILNPLILALIIEQKHIEATEGKEDVTQGIQEAKI